MENLFLNQTNAKISLFKLIESGGLPSDIILIILAILSLITIYILVERVVWINFDEL